MQYKRLLILLGCLILILPILGCAGSQVAEGPAGPAAPDAASTIAEGTIIKVKITESGKDPVELEYSSRVLIPNQWKIQYRAEESVEVVFIKDGYSYTLTPSSIDGYGDLLEVTK